MVSVTYDVPTEADARRGDLFELLTAQSHQEQILFEIKNNLDRNSLTTMLLHFRHFEGLEGFLPTLGLTRIHHPKIGVAEGSDPEGV